MLKEIKYVIYLITIFFFIFFIVNFYLSENNIKRTNEVINRYKNGLNEKFNNLPMINEDTSDIIEHTNEIEEFKNKKQRKFWDLFKTNER